MDKAPRGDVSWYDTTPIMSLLLKGCHAVEVLIVLILADTVWNLAVFGFADVGHVIGSFNNDVNLGVSVSLVSRTPRVKCSANTVDVQGVFDLVNVRHADTFKSQSPPCVYLGCMHVFAPKLCVVDGAFHKLKIE